MALEFHELWEEYLDYVVNLMKESEAAESTSYLDIDDYFERMNIFEVLNQMATFDKFYRKKD